MKKQVVLIAALALTGFAARAQQTIDDGIKMVRFERYTTAQSILQPQAASNPLANYWLGLSQLGQQDYNAAKATFGKYPDDAANMAGLSRANFLTGNKTEGDRLAKAAADKGKKKDWQPLLYAADAENYGGGDIQQAIDWYTAALAKAPDNADILIDRGDAYQKLSGGGGNAMTDYESVTGKNAKNSLSYSRQGALWYAAKNYTSALASFGQAKDADPSNPLPYRDLGLAYFYVGKYELAKQNIEQYYSLSDKTCDDKITYANVLYLAKYYAEAIAQINDVQSTCQGKPYLFRVLGYSQYETKDYSNAMQNMRQFFAKQDASKVLPSDYRYMGLIDLRSGSMDSGNYYLNKAITADTSSDKSQTYRDIADALKDMKNDTAYAAAGQWYGRIVTEYPDKAKPLDYYYWGFWSFYGKKYDVANHAFELMEQKFPDQPSATFWHGRAAASALDPKSQTCDAAPYFEKWLAIPDNAQYTKKPDVLTVAYQYLAACSYNKGDKAKTREYLDKLNTVSPGDSMYKQITELMNKPAGGTTKPAAGKK